MNKNIFDDFIAKHHEEVARSRAAMIEGLAKEFLAATGSTPDCVELVEQEMVGGVGRTWFFRERKEPPSFARFISDPRTPEERAAFEQACKEQMSKQIIVDGDKLEHLLNCMCQLSFTPTTGRGEDEAIIRASYLECRDMWLNAPEHANAAPPEFPPQVWCYRGEPSDAVLQAAKEMASKPCVMIPRDKSHVVKAKFGEFTEVMDGQWKYDAFKGRYIDKCKVECQRFANERDVFVRAEFNGEQCEFRRGKCEECGALDGAYHETDCKKMATLFTPIPCSSMTRGHVQVIIAASGPSDEPEPPTPPDQEADANPEPIAVCVCSTQDLMIRGCECGAATKYQG